jgi:hypothetical protein
MMVTQVVAHGFLGVEGVCGGLVYVASLGIGMLGIGMQDGGGNLRCSQKLHVSTTVGMNKN